MFEKGEIQRDPSAQGDNAALLREVRWAELVAQLAVTRDLRAEALRKPDELQIIGRFKSLSTSAVDARREPPADDNRHTSDAPMNEQQDAPGRRDAQ